MRKSAAIVILFPVVLLLAACAPTPAPAVTVTAAAPPPVATPSATPTPVAAPLPADALFQLTGTATASNGAAMDLSVVVLKSVDTNDTTGLERAKAINKKCLDDETPLSLLTDPKQGYGLGKIEYTATLHPGSAAWPNNLRLQVYPNPQKSNSIVVAHGDVNQVAYLDLSDPGAYEPYCVQRGFMDGPGSGYLTIGWQHDTTAKPAFSEWASTKYGFTFDLPVGTAEPKDPNKQQGKIKSGRVTVSNCVSTVTDLGKSLGAPSDAWADKFTAVSCSTGVQ